MGRQVSPRQPSLLLFAYTLGRYFVQSNRSLFQGSTGLAVSREKSGGGEPDQNAVSAVVSATYRFFLYNFPRTNIQIDLTVLPSVTNWSRTRADFNAHLRREIVTDFIVNFSAYTSYDSDPPNEAASKNDYGIVLSVGWTF